MQLLIEVVLILLAFIFILFFAGMLAIVIAFSEIYMEDWWYNKR